MQKKFYFLVLFFLVPLVLFAEDIPITLEHAVTPEQHVKGLMGRDSLPPDHGMTFNFPVPHRSSIWMYNMKINLSVAFLDQDKVIREIFDLKAYPHIDDPDFFHARAARASFNASYVLEMNQGWFKNHGVKVGDRVIWNISSPKGSVIKQEDSKLR